MVASNVVVILDAKTLQEKMRLTPPPHVGWLGDGHAIFSGNGRYLLLHTALGCACRWDLQVLHQELERLGFNGFNQEP
jgi:hypothetical protein